MLCGCSDTKNVYTSFLEEGYKRWLDPAKKFYRAEKKKEKPVYKEKRKEIGRDAHYYSKDEDRKCWDI